MHRLHYKGTDSSLHRTPNTVSNFQEPFAKPGKLWAAVSEQLQRLGHQVHDVMNNCIIYEFIFHVFRISAYEQLY